MEIISLLFCVEVNKNELEQPGEFITKCSEKVLRRWQEELRVQAYRQQSGHAMAQIQPLKISPITGRFYISCDKMQNKNTDYFIGYSNNIESRKLER